MSETPHGGVCKVNKTRLKNQQKRILHTWKINVKKKLKYIHDLYSQVCNGQHHCSCSQNNNRYTIYEQSPINFIS